MRLMRVPLLTLFAVVFLPLSSWLHPPLPSSKPSPETVGVASVANPIGVGALEQIRPAVAFNSQAGEYLVVFESEGEYGLHDIVGQRVAADGTPVGSPLYLATAGPGGVPAEPDVAYNPARNEYLLVFESEHTNDDVCALRLLGNGTPTGSCIWIASSSYEERLPKVAFNAATGEYLVVWQSLVGGELGYHHVYAQRVSGTGVLLGGAIPIATTLCDDARPAVAAGEGYLVVWQTRSTGSTCSSQYGIRGWRLRNDGAPLESELIISAQPNSKENPRVAFSPSNNTFLVVWQQDVTGTGTNWDIYGQRVYAYGGLAGGGIAIDTLPNSSTNPDVAYHPNAREFLVTVEYAYSSADHDVYFRRVDESENTVEGLLGLATTDYAEARPRLAPDNAYSYLVAWEDSRNDATQGTDIYADLARLWPLSGRVWAGGVGAETTPVAGVTLQLYCSTGAGLGTLIESRVTDGTGNFVLPVAGYCLYYDIVETDLPGYLSAGATSVGGTVVDSNRIRYSAPLLGQTLDGNKFYDHPPSGIAHCNSCADCTAKLSGGYSLVYLDGDMVAESTTCISFAASNTTFDCQGHLIQGTDASEEFSYGVSISSQARNIVRSCRIKGFGSGIRLLNSSYNEVAGNVLYENGSGLYLSGSHNNTLTSNLIGPNEDGMVLYSANNNALSGNMVCKNQRDISLPAPNSGNTRSGDRCDAIYGWNWNGTSPRTIEWCDQTCTPNEATTCSSPEECLGALTGKYNQVTLAGALSLPGGLQITGNHLTLDCAGHTLSGNGSGVGISLANRLNVTVRNCGIQNYDTGIELRDSSHCTLDQNVVTNNETGIALVAVDSLYAPRENVLSNNNSTANAIFGISLNNVADNTVSDNDLRSNGLYGLWVSGACNNTVTGNLSGPGLPLLYWHDSPNAGTVPAGGYGQVMLCNVQNATVQGLTMDDGTVNGDGIVVLDSSGVQVRNNTLNRTNGLYVDGSQQVTVANNTITSSRRSAVELSDCSNCQVTNNTLQNNVRPAPQVGMGLYVSGASPGLQVSNNTVTGNNVGIRLQDVSSPTLTGNTVRANTASGVAAIGTSGLALSGSEITRNGYGVELDGHSQANLQSNRICYNKTLDVLNENTKSTGSGNTCVTISNWFDAGRVSPGCNEKCIGWYQYLYGYQFPNPSKGMLSFGCPYGGCQGDYVDTFGEEKIYQTVDICIGVPLCVPGLGCACIGYEAKVPTPIPRPHATAWYFAAYAWAAGPGSCTGMSTTSLRFYYGDRRVTDYGPSAQKASDLTYYGDLENAIDAGQGAIMSEELAKMYLGWWASYKAGQQYANAVLDQVKQSLASGQLGSLVMSALTSGHTVVATDVRDVDANTARIYVYDNNYPMNSDWRVPLWAQYYDSVDPFPYITIHKDSNTWEYAAGPGFYSLYFLPYSTVSSSLTIPLKWHGDLFINWGSASSLVTDSEGRRMGWEGDQMVAEIPDAAPYPQIGQAVDRGRGLYMLPRGPYTATFTGLGSGTYSAAVFAGNQMLLLTDIPATTSTRDTMSFYHENDGPPTGGFVFTSSDASKLVTATIGEHFEVSDSARLYTLKCMTVPGGQAVFSVSPDFSSLRLTNRASVPMTCSVELQNTMTSSRTGVEEAFPTATRTGVTVPGMTTAVFAPSNWLDLNHATIGVSLQTCGDKACGVGESPAGCPEDCQKPACVAPRDDLRLTQSAVLCPGSYTLPDRGSPGVIIVDADNLTLDCSSARLVGDGSGTGILAAGRKNVGIIGCVVQGYATGMDLRGAADSQVERSVVTANSTCGIQAANSQRSQFAQNYLATNQTGLDLSNASGARVSANLACGNTSKDISAASQSGGSGSGNRCQTVLGWKDQGMSTCTYPCGTEGAGISYRRYLPLLFRQ
ncbi:MAG: hypothetical protein HPY83_08305 [Anaerolineae bacterium]|nr:hypothetical protein [Anaerolineae bacterium]